MRYSQPFGTPTTPLGSYPRFINGNPVTGTEGSIPPASAFDESQIEIITVIANVGLTPDHSDLTQLWQAIQILIAQKYITAPIVKKVHGPGADFVDLYAAFAWLGNYIITPGGYVTFLVAAGRWVYLTPLEINHPNANKVAVQGGALLGATPSPANISVTGYFSSADGTNQIIYLRSVHATELSFQGGGVSGFVINGVGGITLRYLLITGDQSAPGVGIDMRVDVILDGISIWGFGRNGINVQGCYLYVPTSLSLTVCYCGQYNINVFFGWMYTSGGWVITASARTGGLNLYGSSAFISDNTLVVKGCGAN